MPTESLDDAMPHVIEAMQYMIDGLDPMTKAGRMVAVMRAERLLALTLLMGTDNDRVESVTILHHRCVQGIEKAIGEFNINVVEVPVQ